MDFFFGSTAAPIDIFQNKHAPLPPHELFLVRFEMREIFFREKICETLCCESIGFFKNNGYKFLANCIKKWTGMNVLHSLGNIDIGKNTQKKKLLIHLIYCKRSQSKFIILSTKCFKFQNKTF